MAVLCEAISVVVRRDSIDIYFKGGWVKFQENVPNSTICSDGELVRIGFMDPDSVQKYIEFLEGELDVEISIISTGPERRQTIFKS